jgi:hypothetical protein
MKGKGKQEGRVIYRAYEENNGKAQVAVLAAIKKAGDALNARVSVKG